MAVAFFDLKMINDYRNVYGIFISKYTPYEKIIMNEIIVHKFIHSDFNENEPVIVYLRMERNRPFIGIRKIKPLIFL